MKVGFTSEELIKRSNELQEAVNGIPTLKLNCETCLFFEYRASWGHGWCHNQNSIYSGKLRGNGPSCDKKRT